MDFETRLAALERQQTLLQAQQDLWQTIARYARSIDEQCDDDLAELLTDDVVLQTQPWTQRPLVGEGLSPQSLAELSSGLSVPTAFHHEPSACPQRRWHSQRLRYLVGGAITGGAIVLWLGELRVGVSLRRGPVEDQPHARDSGLHDHAGARVGHAGRTHFALPPAGTDLGGAGPRVCYRSPSCQF